MATGRAVSAFAQVSNLEPFGLAVAREDSAGDLRVRAIARPPRTMLVRLLCISTASEMKPAVAHLWQRRPRLGRFGSSTLCRASECVDSVPRSLARVRGEKGPSVLMGRQPSRPSDAQPSTAPLRAPLAERPPRPTVTASEDPPGPARRTAGGFVPAPPCGDL